LEDGFLAGVDSVRTYRATVLLAAALMAIWGIATPARAKMHVVEAAPALSPPFPESGRGDTSLPGVQRPKVVGEALPRIVCPAGYEASIYAVGLSSPDGLAFDPDGVLHVAEETAGRVSRIGSGGIITPVVTGLASPEGIAFDPGGNLYAVEDVEDGRLVCVDPAGDQLVLATGRDAPEGVVWSPDDSLYITESNVQFAVNPPWDYRTRVSRVSQDGEVTVILTNTLAWSYSGITLGADGLLYVANEASGVGTTDSIFRVDPVTGTRTLLVSDLTGPEGLRFGSGGQFPLYVAEEDVGDGSGRIDLVRADGSHEPLCTGFYNIEDVILDGRGNLYVSEDTTGMIVKIARLPPYRAFLPIVTREEGS
jgi:sugar lactone lactonase YvrE